ncbi:MAG: DUF1573 domain-containing protein [Desulfobacterales bacterium]|nr:DUF1573 domain-containing protein [Desulfobacterales bacterium]
MKSYRLSMMLSLLIFAMVCPLVLAQESKGPKMVLEGREFDFGEVKQGKVIEHTFRVLNQGDEVLQIIRVKPG